MTQAESEALYGDEHVRRYQETDGEVGHVWKRGTTVALLTTTGRKSGEKHTHPLVYGDDGSGTMAIIASNGGAPQHPAWYLNLEANPEVEVQIKAHRYKGRARTATDEERAYWWPIMTAQWPDYDEYQKKTDRKIPVVLVEREVIQ